MMGSIIPTSRTEARICWYFCEALTPGFSCLKGKMLPIGKNHAVWVKTDPDFFGHFHPLSAA